MDLRDVIHNFTVTTEEQTGPDIVLNFQKKMVDVNAINEETFMDGSPVLVDQSMTHVKITRSNSTSPMGLSMTKEHYSRTNSVSSVE
jgi:hypothetical protein